MKFRGFDSSIILTSRGGISRPMGEFPGKFEPSNVSRRTVSRGIGRCQGGVTDRAFIDRNAHAKVLMLCCYPSLQPGKKKEI